MNEAHTLLQCLASNEFKFTISTKECPTWWPKTVHSCRYMGWKPVSSTLEQTLLLKTENLLCLKCGRKTLCGKVFFPKSNLPFLQKKSKLIKKCIADSRKMSSVMQLLLKCSSRAKLLNHHDRWTQGYGRTFQEVYVVPSYQILQLSKSQKST